MKQIELENLQALRSYAIVYGLKGAYCQVDGVINDVLMCDVEKMLADHHLADEMGITEFDLYFLRNEGRKHVIQLIAFNAIRRIMNTLKSATFDEDVCDMVKSISVLL